MVLFPLQQQIQLLDAQLGISGFEKYLRVVFRGSVVSPREDISVGLVAVPQCLLIKCWAEQTTVTGWYMSLVVFPIPLLFCLPLTSLLSPSPCSLLSLAVPEAGILLCSSSHGMLEEQTVETPASAWAERHSSDVSPGRCLLPDLCRDLDMYLLA